MTAPRKPELLAAEQVAVKRCTTKEARKVMRNLFKRNYAKGFAAGVKADMTRKRGQR